MVNPRIIQDEINASEAIKAAADADQSELDDINEVRESLGLPPLDTLPGEEDDSFANPNFWQDAVIDKIEDDIKYVAKQYDLDLDYLGGWFDGQKDNLISYLERFIGISGISIPNPFGPSLPITASGDPTTPTGMQGIFEAARLWMSGHIPGFNEALTSAPTSSSGSRGSGSSARGLRAEDFDLDSLMNAVNSMSRSLLLEEADDARRIATAFVQAQVASPHKKLDFETFTRQRLLDKPRAKLIYRNKPESLSEEQYLQPYIQAAAQRIGPGTGEQLANVSIQGARLGASPQAFQARLNRTPQVQGSSPFLRRLGEHVSSIKGVLR